MNEQTLDAIHAISTRNSTVSHSTGFARVTPVISAMLHHANTYASRGADNTLVDDSDQLDQVLRDGHDRGLFNDTEFADLNTLNDAFRATLKGTKPLHPPTA